MTNIIVQLFKEGNTVKDISKKLNISEYKVQTVLSKNGIIEWMKNKPKETVINEVITLYNNNISIKDISQTTKISQKQVNFIIKAYIKQPRLRTTKYNINSNVFEVIDTEEKAYWLGFLYADGYVNKKKCIVELCLKDYEGIKAFADFVGMPEESIESKIVYLNEKQFTNYRIRVMSLKMVNDLINLGCVERKSLILTYPTNKQVPTKFQKYFILGYYDGDGVCRSNKTKGFVGTYDMLQGIVKHLKENTQIKGLLNITPDRNIFQIRLGKADTVLFNKYFYDDKTPYLKRKK